MSSWNYLLKEPTGCWGLTVFLLSVSFFTNRTSTAFGNHTTTLSVEDSLSCLSGSSSSRTVAIAYILTAAIGSSLFTFTLCSNITIISWYEGSNNYLMYWLLFSLWSLLSFTETAEQQEWVCCNSSKGASVPNMGWRQDSFEVTHSDNFILLTILWMHDEWKFRPTLGAVGTFLYLPCIYSCAGQSAWVVVIDCCA